jgi:hypothetical protein
MPRLLLVVSFGAFLAQAIGGNTTGNPCQVITAADVAGILLTPATSKPGPTSATCMYQTATKANVTIGMAHGDEAKGAWMFATTYSGTERPISGIGDQALARVDGTTLVARRGDRSCRVDVVGYDNSEAMDSITKDRGEALARKLGVLCTKLFAANTHK